MTERRYQMIRVKAGDYLLPANDRTKLWRIYRYLEDGSLEGWPESEAWAAAKFRGVVEDLTDGVLDDPTDWEHWEHWAGPYRTRAEAIEAVL